MVVGGRWDELQESGRMSDESSFLCSLQKTPRVVVGLKNRSGGPLTSFPLSIVPFGLEPQLK